MAEEALHDVTGTPWLIIRVPRVWRKRWAVTLMGWPAWSRRSMLVWHRPQPRWRRVVAIGAGPVGVRPRLWEQQRGPGRKARADVSLLDGDGRRGPIG